MAQYLLTSFDKDGPFFGAIYQDGPTLKFWGAYEDAYCEDDGTPRTDIQQMILDENQSLVLFAQAPLYRSFAVLEYSADAPKSTLDRLNKLKYKRIKR